MNLKHLLVPASLLLSSFSNYAAEDGVKVWTPTELVGKAHKGISNVTEFVVEFRVASIRQVTTIYPNGDRRQVPHLVPSDENDFTAPISQGVQATLTRIGITNLDEHFKGKFVKIRGVVSETGTEPYGLEATWVFHIALRSLDQLLAVASVRNQTAEQGGADQPATAPESKAEGGEKPKPEAEGRSQ